MAVVVNLDPMLKQRNMGLTELSDRAGISLANLSLLKSGRARALRFSTLDALCRILECQPGDLLSFEEDGPGILSEQ